MLKHQLLVLLLTLVLVLVLVLVQTLKVSSFLWLLPQLRVLLPDESNLDKCAPRPKVRYLGYVLQHEARALGVQWCVGGRRVPYALTHSSR